MHGRWLSIAALGFIATLALPRAALAEGPQWLGLMRVRDMTPFGLPRLDFLPAHAVVAPEGSFAFELTFTHQNTWALSDNVLEYLESRGTGRTDLTQTDVDAILALPGDAYLVDGEFGLVDLTLHFKISSHVGLYATIPYYIFEDGYLDSGIENFHDAFGFSDAGRSLVTRDQWHTIAKLERTTLVLNEAPKSDLGDPVFGVRYSLFDHPGKWNLVVESAVKVPRADEEIMISTGEYDYGMQLSLQRFFKRNALYASMSGVYFDSPDSALADDHWIPTVVVGWEARLSQHTAMVLQLYGSQSAVRETNLEELTADKWQATLGIQWLLERFVLRFGVTENISSFNNTPDVGLSLSFGYIFNPADPAQPSP